MLGHKYRGHFARPVALAASDRQRVADKLGDRAGEGRNIGRRERRRYERP